LADPEATTQLELPQKLALAQLERHLWGAADILRGKIDSSDYKHYIFGLLFFKRLSDVWEEEYEQRLAEYHDSELAADPDEHRFHIPEGAFWSDVRKHSTDIGEHLNVAFHKMEDANPRLKGVFQDVDFNNKERFPDETLELLLQHFEKYCLRNADVPADMLGDAYQYLIKEFADDAGKKGGEFYTPPQVVGLIIECVQPGEGMSVHDPACGSVGFLLRAVEYLKERGENWKSLSLWGQEANLNTWAICEMNLFLHDVDDAVILRGDTLRNPRHLVAEGSKTPRTFDRVLANPPFSLKSWGHELWSKGDPFGRDKYGCPPKSYGDLAFVQHMVASLKPGRSRLPCFKAGTPSLAVGTQPIRGAWSLSDEARHSGNRSVENPRVFILIGWAGSLMGADQSVEATACLRARLQLAGRPIGTPSRSGL